MEDFSDFRRGQIVGARLAGSSVTELATVLCLSTAAISKVVMAYVNHVKTITAKRDSG